LHNTTDRTPLKKGKIIRMPNGGRYIVEEKIAEGGLSLLYSGKTQGNNYPVVIKEFFPASGATREKTGKSGKKKDSVCSVPGNEERFQRCLDAFQREGTLGTAVRADSYQVISFSDCGNGYAIMPRWSSDTCSFTDLVEYWKNTPPATIDPVFTDLGRLRFSLTAIDSLLSALYPMHNQDMLHLDISGSNSVWSGDRSTGKGSAFLTDFGCSVLMADGAFPVEGVLSYSKDFAAPEYEKAGASLTPATDIYAVGRLLAFLCFGRTSGRGDTEYYVRKLKILPSLRKPLIKLIDKAVNKDQAERYQSVAEMQHDVRELLSKIPARPINPDVSADFTLYNLRSMLAGSIDTGYSWADELQNRRGFDFELPESVREKLTDRVFSSDVDFLQQVLPPEYFDFLKAKIDESADKPSTIKGIMSGNYDKNWKSELVRIGKRYGSESLVLNSEAVLDHTQRFYCQYDTLLNILLEDGCLLEDCGTQIGVSRDCYSHIGLAMLTLFALLGPEIFNDFMQGPGHAFQYFIG